MSLSSGWFQNILLIELKKVVARHLHDPSCCFSNTPRILLLWRLYSSCSLIWRGSVVFFVPDHVFANVVSHHFVVLFISVSVIKTPWPKAMYGRKGFVQLTIPGYSHYWWKPRQELKQLAPSLVRSREKGTHPHCSLLHRLCLPFSHHVYQSPAPNGYHPWWSASFCIS